MLYKYRFCVDGADRASKARQDKTRQDQNSNRIYSPCHFIFSQYKFAVEVI